MPLSRAVASLLLLALTIATPLPAEAADPADATDIRHRLSVSVFLLQERTDDYNDAGNLAGHLAYRSEQSPGVGWTFDVRGSRTHLIGSQGWSTMPATDTRWMLFLGPGVRVRKATSPIRPFLQANAWLVGEQWRTEVDGDVRGNTSYGPGFGAAFGLDIVLSRRIELPLSLRVDHVFREPDIQLGGAEAGVSFGLGGGP